MNTRHRTSTKSRATIADVAKRAGVSIATVSRVTNQTAPVAPKTAALVQAAISELHYRPHLAAQVLASHKTHTIGLLFPEIGGDFIFPLLRGIEAQARENGFALLVYATQDESDPGPTHPQPLGEHNTDGIVVFVDSLPEKELAHFSQIGFPVVLVYRSSPAGLDIPCVTVENKLGARKLVDHLIQAHGFRRIAFLTGQEGHEDSYWRQVGYRESLAAHNIPFAPELVLPGGFNKEMAYASTQNWLRDGVAFDAVFAADDDSAIGVLDALNDAGKRVPEDIAVVGFDDISLSRYLTPPLTTVSAPTEEVGREAVRQLVKLIRGERAESPVLLPTELVIRKSCGCT